MRGCADAERNQLCSLALSLGPDAPTLCEGWTVHDLMAHLYVRENRPLAALGIVIPLFAGVTERAMAEVRERWSFETLVGKVRKGPRGVSPMRVPAVNEAANTVEYFVHHEDLRRANGETGPRVLPEAHDDELWRRLPGFAKLALRRTKPGVIVRRVKHNFPAGEVAVATGPNPVTVSGEAGELILWLFGRRCEVECSGDPEAIEALRPRIA